jgi:hypothetical protein
MIHWIASDEKDCDCTYCRQRVQIADLQACNAKQAQQIAAMITAAKQSIELIRSQPARWDGSRSVIGLLAAVLPVVNAAQAGGAAKPPPMSMAAFRQWSYTYEGDGSTSIETGQRETGQEHPRPPHEYILYWPHTTELMLDVRDPIGGDDSPQPGLRGI